MLSDSVISRPTSCYAQLLFTSASDLHPNNVASGLTTLCRYTNAFIIIIIITIIFFDPR